MPVYTREHGTRTRLSKMTPVSDIRKVCTEHIAQFVNQSHTFD